MSDSASTGFLWKDIFKSRRAKEDPSIAVLRENELFRTLSAAELQYLLKRVYVRTYERGEMVFQEGARGFGMYMLAKGSVEIRTNTNVLVTQLEPGSFFGEMTLIRPESARSASAIATETSVLIGFFKPDLMEILERKPAMGVKILLQLSRVLEERLILTTERMNHGTSLGHKKSA